MIVGISSPRSLLVHPLEYTNDTSLSPGLEAIGKRIVAQCGGMPLAIVVTTSLLSCKEKEEYAWRRVLERMGQVLNECSHILALSYEDLPAYLKPCFLYFGLYPEDHEIFMDGIVRLWMAEGLIQASGGEELEDVGEDYINHMIARNLIQVDKRRSNGRVRSCRIHDLFRSLCISEARKSNFFHVFKMSTNSSERLRRVSTHSLIDYLALTQPIPKIYAMLSFNKSDHNREPTREDLQNFLEDLIYVRVLRIDVIHPVFFSKEFGNLINLTYLKLGGYSTSRAELPSTISCLKNLLTLDVRGCIYPIIPNGIWKMKQLRHILCKYELCYTPSTPSTTKCWLINMAKADPIEVSMPNLRTLCKVSSCEFEADWLSRFNNLRKLGIDKVTEQIIRVLSDAPPISQNLENLRLKWSTNIKAHVQPNLNLSQYENLRTLRLHGPMKVLLEQEKLPPNLTKLVFCYTGLERDPMKVLKKLPKLKILKFLNRSYMATRIVCSGGGADDFPQLEELYFKETGLLELIVEEEAMPILKKLVIKGSNTKMWVPDRIGIITRLGRLKEE